MTEDTSVKVKKFILERLREQYPEMTGNEIFETIVSEENFARREVYPKVLVGDVAEFIHRAKQKYPDIRIKELIEKIDISKL